MSDEYFDDDFEPGAIDMYGGENLIDDHEFNMRVKTNNNEVTQNVNSLRNSKTTLMKSPLTPPNASGTL